MERFPTRTDRRKDFHKIRTFGPSLPADFSPGTKALPFRRLSKLQKTIAHGLVAHRADPSGIKLLNTSG